MSTTPADEINTFNDHAYDWTWGSALRFAAPTVGLLALLGSLMATTLSTGCASQKEFAGTGDGATTIDAPHSSVLDVTPAAAESPASITTTAPPAPSPITRAAIRTVAIAPSTRPAATALTADAPDGVTTQTPTQLASAGATLGLSSGSSSSYTVARGDTLFSIARSHYGDGKQWSRIVSANPGLSPANLKAGQKIVLP